MTAPVPDLRVSEDEYFALLEKSIAKFEYWDGVAVAMAGAQHVHAVIEGNLFGELFAQLRGKTCRPYGSNQAVRLSASRGYVFPDLSVVCGPPELEQRRGIDCLLNSVLIAEILSASTATFDEATKLLAYTALRSIREYLVVDSRTSAVRHYFRSSPDEIWRVQAYVELTNRVTLESCGCSLTLAEIYAGAELEPPQPYFTEFAAE